jgi:hypothetical protein
MMNQVIHLPPDSLMDAESKARFQVQSVYGSDGQSL